MQQLGKFILLNMAEFENYLSTTNVLRVIKLIQNHHTFIPNYSHFKGNNHFALLKGMEDAHIQRGFTEIAQNLTTFPDGTVAICRDLGKIPAGIKGANQFGICIENLGNFDTGGDAMTGSQRDAIIKVNAALCQKFKLTPNIDTIVYHHWYDLLTGARTNGTGSTKTCPGTIFFGGNTVESAQANFIPLVSAALTGNIPAVDNAGLPHGMVDTDVLNVRSGPSTSNDILSQISRGTTVAIFNEQDGWYQIAADDQWVNKTFIGLV